MPDGRRARFEPADLSSPPPSHALRPFVVLGVKEMPLPQAQLSKAATVGVAAVFASSTAIFHRGGNGAASEILQSAAAATTASVGAHADGGLDGEQGGENKVCA